MKQTEKEVYLPNVDSLFTSQKSREEFHLGLMTELPICDIDDFILNSVGAVLAAGIICILRKKICFQKLYYIFVYRKKDMDSFGAVRG